MKKITLICFAIMAIAFSTNAVAQDNASASVNTTANVITPITITGGSALSFGDIVGTSSGGTVTVATDGTRTASATDLTITGTPGTVSAASFTVNGADGYTYAISLPSAFDISNSGGTATMGVGTFVSNPDATGTLTGGTQTVNVGATLTVGADQAPGVYTNATGMTLTVNYN
ncbi:hypothetical protein C7S20_02550 [Christiangramia fulva]|uniref:DUF4402 domain-containing protein n=2 Tax=Christiangramia fulva TaxID=2126553 RepID=A0A2R3ZAP0_9FLAO|nr:hypothetical protein C7S20_02550 [Christiangramia fulva]